MSDSIMEMTEHHRMNLLMFSKLGSGFAVPVGSGLPPSLSILWRYAKTTSIMLAHISATLVQVCTAIQ